MPSKALFSWRNMCIVFGAVGLFLVPAFFNTVNAQSQEQIDSALADLSQAYGQPVTSKAQAGEICNEERFLVVCADIGKRYSLYEEGELAQVDAVLDELRGNTIAQLARCSDESCLLQVATELALRVEQNKPALASQLELTTERVSKKQQTLNVAQDAAREIGVDFQACQKMNPDTASIDLLRSCARLAQDTNLKEYIPEKSKKAAAMGSASVALREALQNGEYSCGNGTLDGCGDFCLNSSDTTAIPAVCTQIAQRFFGQEGVAELERAYSKVGDTRNQYKKKSENIAFTTQEGQTLRDPAQIGKYLEEQGKRGNVEAVEKGLDFFVAHGFVKEKDKNFALGMVRSIRDENISDFDSCLQDPRNCSNVVPKEYQREFGVMEEINSIVFREMNREGVSNPRLCEEDQYGESCLRAVKRALPEVESLAIEFPEAKGLLEDLRSKVAFADQGSEVRGRAREEFDRSGGRITIGNQEFQDFRAVDDFCRVNGQLCLTEAVKSGFIAKDAAQRKYEEASHATPYFPGDIDKEDALRKFEKWLDNPYGAPPVPFHGPEPDPFRPPQPGFPPQPFVPPSCPFVQVAPCSDGNYRPESRDAQGCITFGQCIPFPGYHKEPPDDPRGSYCGNNVCEADEDLYSCFRDCRTSSICYDCESCFAAGCPASNPQDPECAAFQPAFCEQTQRCGDNLCEPGEDQSCPSDCRAPSVCEEGQNFCDYAACPQGCEWNFQGCAVGCNASPPPPSLCGNNVCDFNETEFSCPVDCINPVSVPPPPNNCGDGFCTALESPDSCPQDCGRPAAYCGDFICDPNETSSSCPADCAVTPPPPPPPPANTCGNNICESSESPSSCPIDCDSTYTPSSVCYDCASCETAGCPGSYPNDSACTAFDAAACSTIPTTGTCGSLNDSATCEATKDCSWYSDSNYNYCYYQGGQTTACDYNGSCDSGESPSSCPADCGGSSTSGSCYSIADQSSCQSSSSECVWYENHHDGTHCDDAAHGTSTPPPPASTCGNNVCETDETEASCPADCTPVNTACVTDNLACVTETECTANGFAWCVGDCWSSFNSSPCPTPDAYCGDNACTGDETSSSCPADCAVTPPPPPPPPANTCGNNICESSESPSSCPIDCDSTYTPSSVCYDCASCETAGCPGSYPNDSACTAFDAAACSTAGSCGNNFCDSGETASSCPADCGGSSTSGSCSSNYNDCTTESECTSYNFGWCNGSCWSSFASSPCSTSPSSACGDNVCDSNETSSSCPADCGSSSSSACNFNGFCDSDETNAGCASDCTSSGSHVSYCNNNNYCDSWETASNCASDCSSTPASSTCGDNVCDSDEFPASCPADCGSPDPATECGTSGGTWDGSTCVFSFQSTQDFLAQTSTLSSQLNALAEAIRNFLQR